MSQLIKSTKGGKVRAGAFGLFALVALFANTLSASDDVWHPLASYGESVSVLYKLDGDEVVTKFVNRASKRADVVYILTCEVKKNNGLGGTEEIQSSESTVVVPGESENHDRWMPAPGRRPLRVHMDIIRVNWK
jgi:hypothetical protein